MLLRSIIVEREPVYRQQETGQAFAPQMFGVDEDEVAALSDDRRVPGLMERELRRAMKREKIAELPLYPEDRICKRPTTEQLPRLFSLAERDTLLRRGRVVQTFGMEPLLPLTTKKR